MSNEELPVSQAKQDIIDYTRFRLGDQMIDVDLDKEHYEMAIKQAMIRYRQRTEHAEEESHAFLDLVPETQEYILPREVQSVRQIFRRGTGGLGGGSSQFEPFSSGFLNTYMMTAGRVGGLASYEMFVSYQKLTLLMFGGYINFTFNEATKKLTIIRNIPHEGESVLLWLYNYKPDSVILNDHRAFPWIQDFSYAMAKHMLGEAREKYAQINGPQGGSTLNGAAMKTEAQALMDKLMQDLSKYADGSTPLTWVVG